MCDQRLPTALSETCSHVFSSVGAGLALFFLVINPIFPFQLSQDAASPNSSRTASDSTRPSIYEWHSFTTEDGLPSNQVLAVEATDERIWFGTDAGLVRLEDGRMTTYTPEEGLAHRVVLTLKRDPRTGALWIGTMDGLSRLSGGRFETYRQLSSGLANNVVYGVTVRGRHVWVATAAGANRFDTYTGRWEIYNDTNTPMHERWVYGVTSEDSLVYLATWGGGVMEYNTQNREWQDYTDPDDEMEIDVFPDDGLVHDVVATVSYDDGVLWAGTYFGLSRYDGSRWNGYFSESSGLVSNFINFVKAGDSGVWICTDKGLNHYDGDTWRLYRRRDDGGGEVVVNGPSRSSSSQVNTPTAIGHNYVWKIDVQGDTLWVATEQGVSRGIPTSSPSSVALE